MLPALPRTISLLLATIAAAAATPATGVYLDNGLDQTALERSMSRSERLGLQLEILGLLGLPDRPGRLTEGRPLRRAAPRFLLDVYEALAAEQSDGGGSRRRRSPGEVSFSGEEQHRIEESDVIMTFEGAVQHVSTVRHERGKELWFNISDVPLAEDIVGAELRIYKNSRKYHKNPEGRFTITVYRLINTNGGERQLELISALNTTAKYAGWLSLNVTACLASWVAFPASNKGLYLSVHPLDRPGHEVRPEDLGLLTEKAEDERQPFMVAFMKALNHVRPRVARDTRSKKDTYTNIMTGGYKDRRLTRAANSELKLDQRRSCHIETLYISFKDLKWQDWIIAPEGYAAYYCTGECNFPLNAHMNATNHAIVQTLVHLMYPWRFPIPCCAPTKLSSISVLYFLDDQNVILKKYKKMVVKSCGCH